MISTQKNMGWTEWTLLIILSILWGGSFFFGMVALAELKPFTVVLGRVVIAAILLNLLVILNRRRMPTSPRIWISFAVMGALNNLIPFSLIFWAETRISSGLASIINATTPLWTLLLAHFLTRDERMSFNKIVGLLLGLLGVVTIVGWDIFRDLNSDVLAQFAVLAATFSYALAAIYGTHTLGKNHRGLTPLVTASGQVTCAGIAMIPLACFFDRPWNLPLPQIKTIASILALAILCTVIAYLIYFRLLASTGTSNLLLVAFLIPVSALFLGTLILHENIHMHQFSGMGLIGLGLASIDGRIGQIIKTYYVRLIPKNPSEDYTI